MKPTKMSILARMAEYRKVGRTDFLQTYANGRGEKTWRVSYKGHVYPLKALWAASHGLAVEPRSFNTRNARIGFSQWPEFFVGSSAEAIAEAKSYREGIRRLREASFFSRTPQLRTDAIQKRGCSCEVCKFDFQEAYGELGSGFIECHHLKAIAEGPRDTTIADVALLCSNCHSMVHRRKPMMSLDELRAEVRNRS